jgi:multiple sugar transport system ATP-binding protein
MTGLSIRNLRKTFGDVVAVNDLNLDIEPHSFLTLLGPSGCGKTTTLRSIGGLEEPNSGEIRIGDKIVFSSKEGMFTPPGERGIGFVFQSYALWPHMKVFENIAFGLEIQKLNRTQIAQRVKESLAALQMESMEERYPAELSGGQQQRVALARMLATRPNVFLMDEPLSNLDARLRLDMRSVLKRLHLEAEATTIYVTHDQMEAMTMSTQIAVIEEGKLLQFGTPDEIYQRPATLFVAGFIGSTKINVLESTALEENGEFFLDVGSFKVPIPAVPVVKDLFIAIRPEDMTISPQYVPGAIKCTVYTVMPTGSEIILQVKHEDKIITVKGFRQYYDLKIDQVVWLSWKVEDMKLYDKETKKLVETVS